jgi:hypothetical protein
VSDIKRNLNFLGRLSKNSQISNAMNILPMAAQLFSADGVTGRQTDGRTDGQKDRHNEANSSFRQFRERAQKWKFNHAN